MVVVPFENRSGAQGLADFGLRVLEVVTVVISVAVVVVDIEHPPMR